MAAPAPTASATPRRQRADSTSSYGMLSTTANLQVDVAPSSPRPADTQPPGSGRNNSTPERKDGAPQPLGAMFPSPVRRLSRRGHGSHITLRGVANTFRELSRLSTLSKRHTIISSLAPYVPDIVMSECLTSHRKMQTHSARVFEGVVVMFDVSGYTKLAELAQKPRTCPSPTSPSTRRQHLTSRDSNSPFSRFTRMRSTAEIKKAAQEARRLRTMRQSRDETLLRGAEDLQVLLNAYFSKVMDIIVMGGGDIIRLAGDAIIVLFRGQDEGRLVRGRPARHSTPRREQGAPTQHGAVKEHRHATTAMRNGSQLQRVLMQALCCAMRCVRAMDGSIVEGRELRLHVGVGAGRVVHYEVGGEHGHWHYMLAGPAFSQLENSLEAAKPGVVGVSPEAVALLGGAEAGRTNVRWPADVVTSAVDGMLMLRIATADDASAVPAPGAGVATGSTADSAVEDGRAPLAVDTSPSVRIGAHGPTQTLSELAAADQDALPEDGNAPPSRSPAHRRERARSTDDGDRRLSLIPYTNGAVKRQALLDIAISSSQWTEDMLRAFVPDPVVSKAAGARNGWIPCVQRVTAMFILLDCAQMLSADMDESESLEALQRMFVTIQVILLQFGAVVKEFTLDDKGYVVVAGFGVPPFIHPHDEQRAVSAALRVAAELEALDVSCTIGLATGVIFCSAIGSNRRREFALVGPAMNLAARLMCAKCNSGVLVDEETYRASKQHFTFRTMAPIRVKNISEPVPVYAPVQGDEDALFDRPPKSFSPNHLVGRRHEQATLLESVHRLWRGRSGGWIAIDGDPGVGKTLVVRHCAAAAEKMGLRVVGASGDPIEAGGPHKVWREVLIQLLIGEHTLDRTPDWNSEQISKMVLRVLSTEQCTYAFLLNDLVPLQIAPTPEAASSIAQLSTQDRTEHLIGLVYTLVVAAANDLLESFDCGERLLLLIEDATWLDALSCQLLHRLAHRASDCVLIWTVARRITQASADHVRRTGTKHNARKPGQEDWSLRGTLARGGPRVHTLTVSTMTSRELGRMLVHQLGCRRIHRTALKLLHARSGGNPYFAQQLGAHMLQHGLLTIVTEGGAASKEEEGKEEGKETHRDTPPAAVPPKARKQLTLPSVASHYDLQAAAAVLRSGTQTLEEGDMDVGRNAQRQGQHLELRLARAVEWSTVTVPHTLERAIFAELTRVLTPAELFTLKLAAVIGRSFSVWLLHKVHPTPVFVPAHLHRLASLRFIEVQQVGTTALKHQAASAALRKAVQEGMRRLSPTAAAAAAAAALAVADAADVDNGEEDGLSASTKRLMLSGSQSMHNLMTTSGSSSRMSASPVNIPSPIPSPLRTPRKHARRPSSASTHRDTPRGTPRTTPRPSPGGESHHHLSPTVAAVAAAMELDPPPLLLLPKQRGGGPNLETAEPSLKSSPARHSKSFSVSTGAGDGDAPVASRQSGSHSAATTPKMNGRGGPLTGVQMESLLGLSPGASAMIHRGAGRIARASHPTHPLEKGTGTGVGTDTDPGAHKPGAAAHFTEGGVPVTRDLFVEPESGMASSADTTCQFRKLLVQEVLYQSLPFSHRTKLHRRIAEMLETVLQSAESTASTMVRAVQASSPRHATATEQHKSTAFRVASGGAMSPNTPPPPRRRRLSLQPGADPGTVVLVEAPSTPPRNDRAGTGDGGGGGGGEGEGKGEEGGGASAGASSSAGGGVGGRGGASSGAGGAPSDAGAAPAGSSAGATTGGEGLVLDSETMQNAANVEHQLSITPVLVHHWCLAQDDKRALKLAKGVGQATLLRYALREIQAAFPHLNDIMPPPSSAANSSASAPASAAGSHSTAGSVYSGGVSLGASSAGSRTRHSSPNGPRGLDDTASPDIGASTPPLAPTSGGGGSGGSGGGKPKRKPRARLRRGSSTFQVVVGADHTPAELGKNQGARDAYLMAMPWLRGIVHTEAALAAAQVSNLTDALSTKRAHTMLSMGEASNTSPQPNSPNTLPRTLSFASSVSGNVLRRVGSNLTNLTHVSDDSHNLDGLYTIVTPRGEAVSLVTPRSRTNASGTGASCESGQPGGVAVVDDSGFEMVLSEEEEDKDEGTETDSLGHASIPPRLPPARFTLVRGESASTHSLVTSDDSSRTAMSLSSAQGGLARIPDGTPADTEPGSSTSRTADVDRANRRAILHSDVVSGASATSRHEGKSAEGDQAGASAPSLGNSFPSVECLVLSPGRSTRGTKHRTHAASAAATGGTEGATCMPTESGGTARSPQHFLAESSWVVRPSSPASPASGKPSGTGTNAADREASVKATTTMMTTATTTVTVTAHAEAQGASASASASAAGAGAGAGLPSSTQHRRSSVETVRVSVSVSPVACYAGAPDVGPALTQSLRDSGSMLLPDSPLHLSSSNASHPSAGGAREPPSPRRGSRPSSLPGLQPLPVLASPVGSAEINYAGMPSPHGGGTLAALDAKRPAPGAQGGHAAAGASLLAASLSLSPSGPQAARSPTTPRRKSLASIPGHPFQPHSLKRRSLADTTPLVASPGASGVVSQPPGAGGRSSTSAAATAATAATATTTTATSAALGRPSRSFRLAPSRSFLGGGGRSGRGNNNVFTSRMQVAPSVNTSPVLAGSSATGSPASNRLRGIQRPHKLPVHALSNSRMLVLSCSTSSGGTPTSASTLAASVGGVGSGSGGGGGGGGGATFDDAQRLFGSHHPHAPPAGSTTPTSSFMGRSMSSSSSPVGLGPSPKNAADRLAPVDHTKSKRLTATLMSTDDGGRGSIPVPPTGYGSMLSPVTSGGGSPVTHRRTSPRTRRVAAQAGAVVVSSGGESPMRSSGNRRTRSRSNASTELTPLVAARSPILSDAHRGAGERRYRSRRSRSPSSPLPSGTSFRGSGGTTREALTRRNLSTSGRRLLQTMIQQSSSHDAPASTPPPRSPSRKAGHSRRHSHSRKRSHSSSLLPPVTL